MNKTWMIAVQYFTYFGVLGIYLPFFNLYCYHLEFTGAQIGLLSSIRSVTLVVFPMVWGILADRFQSRRPIYLFCNLASVATWSLFLLTRDFSQMLGIALVYGIFYAPIISFLEAFAMDTLGDRKRRYGSLRAWGSVSFILVVLVLGHLLDRYSVELVIPMILAGSIVHALLAFQVPTRGSAPTRPLFRDVTVMFSRQTAVFLIAGFLMLFSHGTYYGFFSIHLEELGLGRLFIGLSWAIAVVAEIIVMVNSQRLFDRFPLKSVLTAAFVMAALRWLILGTTRNPSVILISQVLHAGTYAAFHMSSILYIDRMAPGSTKTLWQAANNALSYGLGLMAGFIFNGALYDSWTAAGLFRLSAVAALVGGAIFGLLGGKEPPHFEKKNGGNA